MRRFTLLRTGVASNELLTRIDTKMDEDSQSEETFGGFSHMESRFLEVEPAFHNTSIIKLISYELYTCSIQSGETNLHLDWAFCDSLLRFGLPSFLWVITFKQLEIPKI